MRSSFFQEFKDNIKEEHQQFDTHTESTDISIKNCSHADVKMVDGVLRCKCGAAWSGGQLNVLFDYFTKKNKI